MQIKEVDGTREYKPIKYYYRNSPAQLIRPMTLTGTIGPAFIGTGLAGMTGTIDYRLFILFLAAALLVQSAINIFNDYYDFKYGQDKEKWAKQETGGWPISHNQLPYMAGGLLAIAGIIGILIANAVSSWVLAAGIISIIGGIKYSAGKHSSLAANGLGELTAAIFLGFIMMMLSYTIQGKYMDLPILFVSIPMALLIASMILTNNIRDLEKDRPFRRTLAGILGRKKALILLASTLITAYLSIITLIFLDILPWLSIIVLFASPLTFKLASVFKRASVNNTEKTCMKWVAWHHWAFSLLLSASIWLIL